MKSPVKINKKTFNVAVLGATGAVGLEMIRMLEARKFPVKSLTLFASQKSLGKKLKYQGSPVNLKVVDNEELSNIELALFSAGARVSKEMAPRFSKQGTYVIDNSSAWRMEPNIPLVVPEVNSHALTPEARIIANPNCSTIQMVLALKPLHVEAKIKSIRVATYQSVSGAGGKAIQELEEQTKAWAENKKIPPSQKLPQQSAFNLIPHIDVFVNDNYTKEEMKLVNETRKILEDSSIKVSATCVRVPVFRSHAEAVWIETEKPLSVDRAKALLSKTPGIIVVDDPSNHKYPMPVTAEGQSETFVGRIRKDLASKNGLLMWVVSDNLLKGAALNAVQIAESLIQRNILK